MERIEFYSESKPYGWMSNFAKYPIVIDGKVYPTSEHYFQAQKYTHVPEYYEQIRTAPNPTIAKRLGGTRSGTRKIPLRANWEKIKNNVMKHVVTVKFTSYPELKEKLLATGNSPIAEHTANDNYWADGGDGSGKNMLGIILMEVRRELAQK